jgi:hypothetical protein
MIYFSKTNHLVIFVFVLEDDTQSLNHALEVVELSSICSGLRANFDKTQAVWIGARRSCGEELQTNKPIKWNHSGAFWQNSKRLNQYRQCQSLDD